MNATRNTHPDWLKITRLDLERLSKRICEQKTLAEALTWAISKLDVDTEGKP